MIKIVIFVVRKDGMSFEDFDRYWRESHAPIIKSTTEFSRHVRKYVQAHKVSGDVPFAVSGDYDGVAELWFDSVEDMNTAFSEPRYLEVIRPDELKFVNLEKCVSIVCDEFQVI